MSRPGHHVVSIVGPLLCAVLALGTASCSKDATSNAGDSKSDTSTSPTTTTTSATTTTPTTTTQVERPEGRAAAVGDPLASGSAFLGEASQSVDLAKVGYVQSEFIVAGTAMSYKAADLPADGRFDLQKDAIADYRTRIVVRKPEKASAFNGTVVVEWLNVSGGIDANPDWSYGGEELARGYAWVGVSAQRIGIEGGAVAVAPPGVEGVAGKGLKKIDPTRYGTLSHPGDAFSYDIYTQVARALRTKDSAGILGDLVPKRLIAIGESQSGFALTTYANGVQPLTRMFDGFLIHSRGGAAAPLGMAGEGIDITSTVGGKATKIRTDLDVPVLVLESESDVVSVLNYLPARQDDSKTFRLWEMAGTAHADVRLLGAMASSVGCPNPINDGPHHFVQKAAIRAIDTWVRTGEAPPKAPRLEVSSDGKYVRDENGIVKGGIRTPQVDVPIATLSGDAGPAASVFCLLLGSSKPLSSERLATLYTSRADYLERFTKSADATIKAGFVLEDERDALLADAKPDKLAG